MFFRLLFTKIGIFLKRSRKNHIWVVEKRLSRSNPLSLSKFVKNSFNRMTEQKKIHLKFGLIALFIFFAAFSRLIPHWPNFTPIGGMALFGAAYFSRKYWAFVIPFAALWLSDLVINNLIYGAYFESFQWWGSTGTYLGFALIALAAFPLLRKVTPGRLLAGSLSASMIFFLVSNFFVWLGSGLYPPTLTGLMACYAAGLEFFWNTLAGDLFYTTVLFGSYALASRKLPLWEMAK